MPVESAEVARHPYRCRITWIVSLHTDGVGYARADSRETLCDEYFDPLGGRNAQQRPVCSVPLATKLQTRQFLTLQSLGILLTIVSKSPRCLVLNVSEGPDRWLNIYLGKG